MAGEDIGEGSGDLRLAAISYSFPECQAVAAMLRGYGIPSRLHPWLAATVDPAQMVAIGGVHVMVPELHLLDARALLQAAEPWVPELSADWHRWNPLEALILVIALLLMGFVPPPRIYLDFGQAGRAAHVGGSDRDA